MVGMHAFSKHEREALRQLLHKLVVCDLGGFQPETFKTWIKQVDGQFRKIGFTIRFEINNRAVTFSVKEIRSGRTIARFVASTHVRFDDDAVMMLPSDLTPTLR